MLNRSERLDRRITIERATVTHNELNEPVETWGEYATLWVHRDDVSDGERFAAGQVGSFLMSRFVVRHSSLSKGIRATDRIVYDGGYWNIFGVKETKDGRNRFLEITAARDADVVVAQESEMFSEEFSEEFA